MTNMFSSRDRSVVRSSVIPSAKYCWSGSLLRLVKGSTTIDSRSAWSGWAIVVVEATADGEGFVAGQNHHAPPAIASGVVTAATIATPAMRRRGTAIGKLVAGRSATA